MCVYVHGRVCMGVCVFYAHLGLAANRSACPASDSNAVRSSGIINSA